MVDFLIALVPILIFGVSLALMIWALMDILHNDPPNKYVWVAAVVFAPIVGSLVYMLAGRK